MDTEHCLFFPTAHVRQMIQLCHPVPVKLRCSSRQLFSLHAHSSFPAAGGGGDEGEGSEEGGALARALRKAIESGDTDLVFLVLFHIYRARPLQDFWALVSSRTLARNLFVR